MSSPDWNSIGRAFRGGVALGEICSRFSVRLSALLARARENAWTRPAGCAGTSPNEELASVVEASLRECVDLDRARELFVSVAISHPWLAKQTHGQDSPAGALETLCLRQCGDLDQARDLTFLAISMDPTLATFWADRRNKLLVIEAIGSAFRGANGAVIEALTRERVTLPTSRAH
jgi:hypothetical protein